MTQPMNLNWQPLSNRSEYIISSLEMSVRSQRREGTTELLRRRTKNAMRQRESDLGVVELNGIGTLAILSRYSGSANDLDGLETSTVSSCHIIVHGVNSIIQRDITILSVHIVCTTSRVIFDPDCIILDKSCLLLKDLFKS